MFISHIYGYKDWGLVEGNMFRKAVWSAGSFTVNLWSPTRLWVEPWPFAVEALDCCGIP